MKYIDDYITEILSKINRELKVLSVIPDGVDNIIEVCNFKWLKLFNHLIIDGVESPILSIDESNRTILVMNPNVTVNSVVKLPDTPFFIGSRMITSSEWLLYSNDYRDKVPFVWLNFPAGIEKITNDKEYQVELWKNIRLFFVADMDRSQWVSKETLDNRTKVLSIWANFFKKAVQYPLEIESKITEFPHPIFGVETENGAIKDIIDGNLSAVSIGFDLTVKEVDCFC